MAGDDDEVSDYVLELNQRHERFLALGGGTDLQMEMKGWTPLKDLVTEQHRKVVFDLAASGLSHEAVAEVMGISKERLQALFKVELGTAYQLCHASLARSLYYQGIAGDRRAASDWLKYHNKSGWGTKTQIAGTPDAAPIKIEGQVSAKSFVDSIIAEVLTDSRFKGESKSLPPPAEISSDAVAENRKAKRGKAIKKVKQE